MIKDCYEYIAPIGSGGMGIIVKARHNELDVEVAIKMLLRESSPASLGRFKQEAKASSRLTHENIIGIRDFGITPDGHAFMVMDLLQGENLADLIKINGALSIGETLKIFEQLCSAMTYAHSKGIVHRDLKPSNIMLTHDHGGTRKVKVLDFGIAKVMQTESSGELSLTKTGEIFGSPLYMSPEQALGKKVDQRSDIYSAGCVLFHVLTGAPPLHGDSAIETLMQHINTVPLSLSEASLGRQFPKQLEAIAAKALAKNQIDRYQSFEELAADLRSFSEGKVTDESKEKQQNAGSKRASNKLVWAGAVLGALVVIGLVGYFVLSGGTAFNTRTLNQKNNNIVRSTEKQSANDQLKHANSKEVASEPIPLEGLENLTPNFSSMVTNLSFENGVFHSSGKDTSDNSIKQLIALVTKQHQKVFIADLNGSAVTNEGIRLLCGQPLKELSINNTNITGDCAASLAKMHSTLKHLNMAGLKGATPQNLKNLAALSNLESLDLSYTSNLTAADLAFLPALKKLDSLNLESNPYLTDEAIGYVAQLPNLTSLKLSYSGFTNVGLSAVEKMKSLKSLTACGTCFGDSGIMRLSSLKQLRSLDLSDTLVTAKSIPMLARMNQLRDLYLNKCRGITKVEMSRLTTALPSCVVHPDRN
jgi:serine/threonine protein kinase